VTTDLFDDGKEGGALRTIGEVGRALGVKAHVLRYWEEQFPTLRPLKRSGGRRYYRAEDVALVQRISRLLTQEGYTIRGARAAIESGMAAGTSGSVAVPPPAEIGNSPVPDAPLDRNELIARLQNIRSKLVEALS
jgi:DNA-binding transcriptional MerR regulator